MIFTCVFSQPYALRASLLTRGILLTFSQKWLKEMAAYFLCRRVSYLTADCTILFESGEMKISQIYKILSFTKIFPKSGSYISGSQGQLQKLERKMADIEVPNDLLDLSFLPYLLLPLRGTFSPRWGNVRNLLMEEAKRIFYQYFTIL